MEHPQRPTPGLFSVTYLWCVHLSHSRSLLLQERNCITHALKCVTTDTLSSHPNRHLHTLQAEILLSYYFLRTGRVLEAKTHASVSVALALDCGLHMIGSQITHSLPFAPLHVSAHSIPRSVEENEQINGFWAVFTLHKFVAIASDAPSSTCGAFEAPGMHITTPWPSDHDVHQAVRRLYTSNTAKLTTFKHSQNPPENGSTSHCSNKIPDIQTNYITSIKASILLHGTVHHVSQSMTPSFCFMCTLSDNFTRVHYNEYKNYVHHYRQFNRCFSTSPPPFARSRSQWTVFTSCPAVTRACRSLDNQTIWHVLPS